MRKSIIFGKNTNFLYLYKGTRRKKLEIFGFKNPQKERERESKAQTHRLSLFLSSNKHHQFYLKYTHTNSFMVSYILLYH